MAKFTGKRVNFGIAKEASRGTPESAVDYFMPKISLSVDDKVEHIEDPASVGVIEDIAGLDLIKKWSEGDFEGPVEIDSFGLVLLAFFGTDTPSGPVDSAIDHVFTVAQSSQHQSLSLFYTDDNQDYISPLAVVRSLSLVGALGSFLQFTAGFIAKVGATATETASYVASTRFLPQHITAEFKATQSALDNSSLTTVKNFTLDMEKVTEEDLILSDIEPVDFHTVDMKVEGTLEMIFDSNQLKLDMIADTVQALRLRMENDSAGALIGASTNPSLQFDLHAVKITEFTRNNGNGEMVSATVAFRAYYKSADSAMITSTLVNEVASY